VLCFFNSLGVYRNFQGFTAWLMMEGVVIKSGGERDRPRLFVHMKLDKDLEKRACRSSISHRSKSETSRFQDEAQGYYRRATVLLRKNQQ